MESKKKDHEQKSLKRTSYNNRKECIKKKTMELATLCGIDACTVMFGVDGEIESWPEDPKEAKAIIKKFKDLTSNPHKRTTVKDESRRKVVDVPGGEVVSCQENSTEVKGSFENFSTKKVFAEKAEIVGLGRMVGSLCSRPSLLTEYQECLKQVDDKLEALLKRIEFLRTDQECGCMVNKQLDYSEMVNKQLGYSEKKKRLYYPENSSPKRRKVSEEPVFLFDLNFPPPDQLEASSLSSEDCSVLPNR
ncbi:hypothetical protein DCAR_0208498 [Daucus carota subsp. sativus]|uniref:Uncharacterized protein n=1 Tax=Daucus carota subsp. sativus TaxID=79200 RepID=A0A161XI25_DAUCS|nr:PREDICTED: uncharacterized protein LOC108205604 [Daucus carota subsp. sativus]WOG89261.1 hypothetical protein DCAR_0208498 [Daucus carota subsp. sativus]